MAERQDLEFRQYGAAGPPRTPADETEPSTSRLELPRAPSPTEARQIIAIPVIPEDFVPMAPRTWSPSRKYWAAAATCHGPLYFQDAALERYGQSAEQALGPVGRCLTYPLDDPTQSDQRNQILQPFFSIGKFASQIVLLPYNLVVDPPGRGRIRPGLLPPRRPHPHRYPLPARLGRRPPPARAALLRRHRPPVIGPRLVPTSLPRTTSRPPGSARGPFLFLPRPAERNPGRSARSRTGADPVSER